ncbi:MAG: HAD family hydrolase [Erysipelotrichaceae bacterium]|nr:HAD family hydrolase [Erysipelotrichaceae bacterium]
MGKKIVFIDCDNTLVYINEDYEQCIPESAFNIIKKARDMGILVYLCTGRSLSELDGPVSEVEFDGIIGGSGAFILEDGDIIYERVMDYEDVKEIIEFMEKEKVTYFIEGNDGIYANKMTRDFFKKDRMTVMLGDIMRPIEEADLSKVNKIEYMSSVFSAEEVNNNLKNKYDIVGYSYGKQACGGEISTKGISKGSAVRYVLEAKGIDINDSYGIGDSGNDIEMFKNTGTAIAVGNASDEVKRFANYISKDADEDGIEYAFINNIF